MTTTSGDKMRTYKAPDGLYDSARAAASYNDENLSQVIRRALETYVAETETRQRRKAAAAKRRRAS